MSDLTQRLTDSLGTTLAHLADIPMQVLSVEGLSKATGFMLLSTANQYIRPSVRAATRSMPASEWIQGIYDGGVMAATFIYGGK